MSELVSAAAAALGVPEALAQRSAEARAAETGASVEDILSAWAGGAPAPAATPSEAPAETPAEAVEASTAPAVEESQPAIEVPVPTAPAEPTEPAPVGPYRPPVLVGVRDNPMTVLAAALALFVIIALTGLIGPASTAEEPGARSSEIPYSQTALEGRDIYGSLGCASCHTQMVRPVVADVGLGGVTLNDSNQVLGIRRFGPDLADVGTRLSDSQIEATIGGFGGHPVHSLSPDDMGRLVAYLSQSKTSGGG